MHHGKRFGLLEVDEIVKSGFGGASQFYDILELRVHSVKFEILYGWMDGARDVQQILKSGFVFEDENGDLFDVSPGDGLRLRPRNEVLEGVRPEEGQVEGHPRYAHLVGAQPLNSS